jgi:hypothetical protein
MTFLRNRVLVPALRLPVVLDRLLDGVAELDVGYRDSSLAGEPAGVDRTGDGEAAGVVDRVRFRHGPHAGDRAPDAEGQDGDGTPVRLFDLFRGTHSTLLLFDGPAPTDAGYRRMAATARAVGAALGDDVRTWIVVPGDRRPDGLDDVDVFLDPDRDAHHHYAATAESLYLVRPDGYIAFRSQPAAARPVLDHLGSAFRLHAPA